MTTEDDFQTALDVQPDAHHLRLVFADWLQERDDARAPGYRALGALQRLPFIPTDDMHCPWFGRAGVFSTGMMKEYCALPPDWFALIELDGRSHDFAPDHDIRTDATRREVEDAAALAFAQLPAARRAELLAGTGVPA